MPVLVQFGSVASPSPYTPSPCNVSPPLPIHQLPFPFTPSLPPPPTLLPSTDSPLPIHPSSLIIHPSPPPGELLLRVGRRPQTHLRDRGSDPKHSRGVCEVEAGLSRLLRREEGSYRSGFSHPTLSEAARRCHRSCLRLSRASSGSGPVIPPPSPATVPRPKWATKLLRPSSNSERTSSSPKAGFITLSVCENLQHRVVVMGVRE